MGSKGRSPTIVNRVRSLVSFKGDHEMFNFDPEEEKSLQKTIMEGNVKASAITEVTNKS
tara:strand:+ start:221 stop:397 length:177 start_codon:yes stop_codon:yes gene_type:complete